MRTGTKVAVAFAIMALLVLGCGLAVWFGMVGNEQLAAAGGDRGELVREMRFTRWMILMSSGTLRSSR